MTDTTAEYSFRDAVGRLADFGITGEEVYLVDMVLLAEMAWADDRIQEAEVELLFAYLAEHVQTINRLAGCMVLHQETARTFLQNLIDNRSEPELLSAIREIFPAVRMKNKPRAEAEAIREAVLDGCLDIAASAVTRYPYGLKERFTEEEKRLYHNLQQLLDKKMQRK